MSILIVLACILLLVLLITWGKINAFIAFLVVSVAGGLMLGIGPADISKTVQKGIGDMLGGLAVVVVAGSMLGKLVAETGAAQQIASGLMRAFGEKRLQLAFMVTGFVIGLPLFYNVAFILVFPLIAGVVYRYKLPAVYVGIPMVASLSVTHGFLPPHPSPAALVTQFGADTGMTLLLGTAIAIPTVLIAGPLFSRTLKGLNASLLPVFQSADLPENQLPGLANSLLTSLLPVIMLTATTVILAILPAASAARPVAEFLADPSVVMIIALGVACFSLGIGRGLPMSRVMSICGEAVRDVAMVMLIMGGAGGLKQVLIESGVSTELAGILDDLQINPLVLGWLLACLVRVSVGSATVAGLTAAGIAAPLVAAHPEIRPELMVLAVGSGSLMFSHVNDAGFWLFKEYFNLSIRDTIRSWSLMETIVAVCGLAGVLALQYLFF